MKEASEARSRSDPDVFPLDPYRFSVQELREAIFGDTRRIPNVLALALLRVKDYPEREKIADFQRVLQDEHLSPRVRHTAAVELGRLASAEAAAALRASFPTKDRFVQRGVAGALARLEAEIGASRAQVTGPADEWFRTLSSYNRAIPPAIPFPHPGAFLSPHAPREISFEKADLAEAMRASREASMPALPLRLAPGSAVALQCGARSFLFIPTEEIGARAALQQLLRGRAVAGLLAVRETLETDAWSAHHYALTQPADRPDEVQILLVTPQGRVDFAGTARSQGERAQFVLRTVAHPGAVAAEISGTYQDGEVHFERIRSDLRRTGQLAPRPGRGP